MVRNAIEYAILIDLTVLLLGVAAPLVGLGVFIGWCIWG